jgi:hypothetical protein
MLANLSRPRIWYGLKHPVGPNGDFSSSHIHLPQPDPAETGSSAFCRQSVASPILGLLPYVTSTPCSAGRWPVALVTAHVLLPLKGALISLLSFEDVPQSF